MEGNCKKHYKALHLSFLHCANTPNAYYSERKLRIQTDSKGFKQIQMDSNEFKWIQMNSNGFEHKFTWKSKKNT